MSSLSSSQNIIAYVLYLILHLHNFDHGCLVYIQCILEYWLYTVYESDNQLKTILLTDT